MLRERDKIMENKDFKDFIMNRTIEDIMEDYGEQRDEWQTMLSMKDGYVVQFRHSNGRTFFCEQYKPEFGATSISHEQELLLSTQSVEKQMSYFYITSSAKFCKSAYGEITKEQLREKTIRLSDYPDIIMLIMKEKTLVGVIIKGYYGDEPLMIDSPVCTYYASDNNGSGSNEREDYAYLMFIDEEKID